MLLKWTRFKSEWARLSNFCQCTDLVSPECPLSRNFRLLTVQRTLNSVAHCQPDAVLLGWSWSIARMQWYVWCWILLCV